MQDRRRRIWIEAGTLRFGSFVELNAWLGGRCRALWGDIAHPEPKEFSVAEMLEQEAGQLMPMPEALMATWKALRAYRAPAWSR